MATRLALVHATALLCATACVTPSPPDVLDLATTTSLQNSGLLDVLESAYRARAGVGIRVHAAGSGRALAMLDEGLVTGVFSHAPEAEAEFLQKHGDWHYRKFASNQFIIVGPPEDPAQVRKAASAIDAFRRIAGVTTPFVSRGDRSGTHERERQLWTLAGAAPTGERLVVSGRGMALALRHAEERQAYALTDEATFRQFAPTLSLQPLLVGDDALINTYAFIARGDDPSTLRFMEWLTGGAGRDQIGSFTIAGRPGFDLWPTNCADDTPSAIPCR